MTHTFNTGLSISPPVTEILLAPNKKIVHAFTLTNLGESTNFVANIHQLIPTDNFGHSTIKPNPINPTTIPLVIKLANADRQLGEPFTIPAHQQTQLVLSIEGANVETTTDSYLALVITPQPNTSTPKNLSITNASISAPLLITLSPDGSIPIKLQIEDFNPPTLHNSTTPLDLSAKLTNSSNIMIRPKTELTLNCHFLFNQQTTTLNLDPNLVLAHTSRQLTYQSTSPTYQTNWYNLGPCNITLNLNTEGDSQLSSISKTTWFIPWNTIFALLFLITFCIYLILKKNPTSSSTNFQPQSTTSS